MADPDPHTDCMQVVLHVCTVKKQNNSNVNNNDNSNVSAYKCTIQIVIIDMYYYSLIIQLKIIQFEDVLQSIYANTLRSEKFWIKKVCKGCQVYLKATLRKSTLLRTSRGLG